MQVVLSAVAGAAGIAIALWLVRNALRAYPRTGAQRTLGLILIAAGIGSFVFRVSALAIPLLILGIGLLLPMGVTKPRASTSRISQVRTAHLEMTLDHDTGNIDGRILRGKRQGQILSELDLSELLQYRSEIQADEESLKLFESFLDDNHRGWRDQSEETSYNSDGASQHYGHSGRDEAYQVLGLQPGASDEEIREAYRRLIKRVHPDSGGSATLTAQITEARDTLLGDNSE